MTVTIDKSGRILIPKTLRDRLGLAAGVELEIDVHDAGDGAPAIELRAVSADAEDALVREGRLLVHNGRPAGDLDVVRLLREQRAARTPHHAGLGRRVVES